MTSHVKEDVWIPTTCGMCLNGCQIRAHRVDGIITQIEGDPASPYNRGKICAKGHSAPMKLYDPYRVKTPLKRTNPEKGVGIDPKFVEISWDEAMDTIADRVRKVMEDDPDRISVSSFDWTSTLIGAAWGLATGTRYPFGNFTTIGSFCGEAIHTYGPLIHEGVMELFDIAPTAPVPKMIIILGASLTEANMSVMAHSKWVVECRDRGMKIVVVDPRMTALAAKGDWVPIRPGTDGALLFAMSHVLLHELNIYDSEYLKYATNACYLIGKDGYYVRDKESGKPLIWDAKAGEAKTYDDETIGDIALEVDGCAQTSSGQGTPAFQL